MTEIATSVASSKVTFSDKTAPTLILKNVKNPMDVKELLHNQVEDCKLRRRVRIGEIMGMDDDGSDEALDDEI